MAATLASPATLPTTLTGELRRHDDDRVALVDASTGDALSFRELWRRVDVRVEELGVSDRSIVLLVGDNSVEFVVSYLAISQAGHVPLLAADRNIDRLIGAWSPGAVVRCDAGGVAVDRADVVGPDLHADLALLLSTSGSTGSPKLVRLSHRNLVENARSIVASLGLTDRDRGITSLPLHYSYGLSLLHTHLLVGGGLVVTGSSVVDGCFADALRRHGVTDLAGVPHTWEMLERAGPDRIAVPTLRLMTQAGGRLAPEAVSRWVERADRWGAEFVVMYGQTEATARIAHLPHELARRRPAAVGRAIPGGQLELRPADGSPIDVGELVYRGPNVMMGYATGHADLARPHELDELPTGDLARFHADDGVFEIVGRRSRFVKPFGLRIDLDEIESGLGAVTADVAASGDDHGIRIFAPGAEPAAVRRSAAELSGLPVGRIEVVTHCSIPRTESGKVDYAAIATAPTGPAIDDTGADRSADADGDRTAAVAAVYTEVLGVDRAVPTDSFVSLGGDSLSYVECSIRLESTLGVLPSDWHLQPIAALGGVAGRRGRRVARVDTSVLLRAVSICLVVSTHMRLRHLPGGAHLMLGIVGYNVARFITPIDAPRDRLRVGLRTVARVAVPTMLWTAVGLVAFGAYGIGTLLLVNNYVGPAAHDGSHWHFWFIEVFVHLVLVALVVLAVPPVRRAERRLPYAFALVLLATALLLRLDWAHMDDWYNLRFRTHGVAWFFALGWLVHRSVSMPQRIATSVIAAASVHGFFGNPSREWLIAAGLVVLVWLPMVPFPRFGVRVAGGLAAASMWIYLSHFTFWPLLDDSMGLRRDVAYVLTIAGGVAVWTGAERTIAAIERRWSERAASVRWRSSRSAYALRAGSGEPSAGTRIATSP